MCGPAVSIMKSSRNWASKPWTSKSSSSLRYFVSARASVSRVSLGSSILAMTTLYGIKNCDTMKKAWTWLDQRGVAYRFHDYKKEGIDRATLEGWVRQLGWEVLLNRSGTTFKKLPDADKAG